MSIILELVINYYNLYNQYLIAYNQTTYVHNLLIINILHEIIFIFRPVFVYIFE